ncbi:MAG: DUF5011 domain-containing protein [bacterium]|nr:DUF5011 domain-containing protein [bacterium]
MYIIGVSGDRVYQYTLSTPWDLSTASYASKLSPSNGSLDATTVKVFLKPDGSKMYLTGFVYGRVYQYTLSTPWDVSTATYDSLYFSTASQTTNPYATTFNSDGTKLFAVGPNDIIHQYTLSTPWDISTTSYDSLSFNANSRDSNLYGLTLKPDDTKIYFTGATNDSIFQYSTTMVSDSTPPTITNVNSDKANGSYTTGEVIDIDVTFSEVVTSTGNVTVTLETGATDRTCTFTVTSATTGTCNYTVQAGDTTGDLTVSTISGTIADALSNAMVNFVPTTNLAANKALVIDTTAPTAQTLSPADDATNISGTANLVITFLEAVNVSSGNIVIKKTSDDSTVETIAVGSGLVTGGGTTTITINPSPTLSSGTSYYITIASTAFVDIATNAYAGISNGTTWNFTIADNVGPIISQVTAVATPTNDTTPNYTFTTDEAGTVSYGGSCSSSTTSATSGSNTIIFSSLSGGTYSNCTIIVTDASSNASNTLAVTAFTIDITAPVLILNGSASISLNQGDSYTDAGATATDDLDNTVSASVQTSGSVNTSTSGTYVLTYSVSDTAGNAATSVSRTVTVAIVAGAVSVAIVQAISDRIRTEENLRNTILQNLVKNSSTPVQQTNSNTLTLFTRTLAYRGASDEVKNLQEFLNAHGFVVAKSGSGSSGKETSYFGYRTKLALSKFQQAHNIKPAVGYFGPLTRKSINEILAK